HVERGSRVCSGESHALPVGGGGGRRGLARGLGDPLAHLGAVVAAQHDVEGRGWDAVVGTFSHMHPFLIFAHLITFGGRVPTRRTRAPEACRGLTPRSRACRTARRGGSRCSPRRRNRPRCPRGAHRAPGPPR